MYSLSLLTLIKKKQIYDIFIISGYIEMGKFSRDNLFMDTLDPLRFFPILSPA